MRTVNLSLAIAVVATCAASPPACDGPTSPSARGDPVLAIEPALSAIKVGETAALRAIERLPDGSHRVVQATWTTDAPTVITVDANGLVKATTTGLASISASAEGVTASLTLQSVPDATGTWSGRTVDIEDARVSGDGPYRPATGVVRPMSFSLLQDGASLSGNAVVDLIPGPIEGTIRSDGRITLKGTFENAEGYRAEITQSLIDLDSAGQAISGQFTITKRFVNFWGPQLIRNKRQILSFTRQQ